MPKNDKRPIIKLKSTESEYIYYSEKNKRNDTARLELTLQAHELDGSPLDVAIQGAGHPGQPQGVEHQVAGAARPDLEPLDAALRHLAHEGARLLGRRQARARPLRRHVGEDARRHDLVARAAFALAENRHIEWRAGMNQTATTLDELIGNEYQHGFVTDLEADSVPRVSSNNWARPALATVPLIE